MTKITVIDGSLYQWDTGRKVHIVPDPGVVITEVHYSYLLGKDAFVVFPVKQGDGYDADIPNEILQVNGYFTVYAIHEVVEDEHTVDSITFYVAGRSKPADYVYTETEVLSYDTLKKRVDEIEENGVSGGGSSAEILTEITYDSLKVLRDSGALVPGCFYRIVDYVTTSVQEYTQSAGHPFDVIVRALDENTLDEEAKAVQREGDEYFAGVALGGWQLWYSLDNDASRFAWADEVNGKGVIYRMIDENGNDCPYDFKNIRMQNALNADDATYYYTFDNNGADQSLNGSLCYANVIKDYIDGAKRVNRIIFVAKGFEVSGNSFDHYCYNNVFSRTTKQLRFGRECYGNNFYGLNQLCTFDTKFRNNIVGAETQSIQVGQGASNNVFGNNIYYSSFGNYFRNNVVCKFMYYSTFGHYVQNCILGDSADAPGQYMRFLTFENNVQYVNLFKTNKTTTTYMENVKICSGTVGKSTSRIMIEVSELAQKYAITYANNSSGVLVKYVDADGSSGSGSGGVDFVTDATLTLSNGVLSVNTADVVEADNTLPVTSAAVNETVGNINVLLETI